MFNSIKNMESALPGECYFVPAVGSEIPAVGGKGLRGTHTLSFTQFKPGTSIYSNAATRYRPVPIAKACVPSLPFTTCESVCPFATFEYPTQRKRAAK
jgi:hypothetical protein